VDKPIIIAEDDSLVVLDKPAGWIVNESRTTKGKLVIQSWLKKNFNFEIVGNYKFRSGIVHRLDKDTSGCLVVAKTKGVFEALQGQFKKREVEKIYTSLVHGKMELKEGNISVPVGRLPWNRERFGVLPGGRSSETSYKVIAYYQKGTSYFSLLKLFPKTGRTHQIRIHLKYLRHPIVSDDFYAGRKTARDDRKWCPRLFLHACVIVFKHPKLKKRVSFKSDLPTDLRLSLQFLNQV
jgi:23S rRNA pseudouridine1911/1915/1917 synthase